MSRAQQENGAAPEPHDVADSGSPHDVADSGSETAFAARFEAAALGFAEVASIALGERLGWYQALARAGIDGLSAIELAHQSNTHPRYAREWLEQQSVAGLLEAVPEGADFRFSLPPGAATVLVDEGSLNYLAPMVRMFVASLEHFPDLLRAYRTGGGVSWDTVGDEARDAQAKGNKPWFEQQLAPALASSTPVHAVLARPGARIVDLGCGYGWSTLALAAAYPEAAVVGVDVDEPSIERARANARDRGLSDRVSFQQADAGEGVAAGNCDAVFIFEALHDMPFPVRVLESIHRMVKPDGVVVVMDEAVADAFAPQGDSLERLMYAYSLLICLPDSLSTPGSVGTGTVLRQATLEGYAQEAGFAYVERLPIENFSVFRFYRLHM